MVSEDATMPLHSEVRKNFIGTRLPDNIEQGGFGCAWSLPW